MKKKKSNQSSAFSNDCGVWDRTTTGTSPNSYYLIKDSGDLMTLFKDKFGHCTKKQVPKPEPENVAIILTYYIKSKLDK